MTDNFVNLLHIPYAWLYKTECWGRKFHAFSFNSPRNCKICMTNFNFIFDTICVPYIFRKSIFGWNCDHDTPLCDTPLLEDTPLCDTPDDLSIIWVKKKRKLIDLYVFQKSLYFTCFLFPSIIMSFPKFVNMTKNTSVLHVFAPLPGLKNNPNYVNFWEDDFQLQIQVPPPPRGTKFIA